MLSIKQKGYLFIALVMIGQSLLAIFSKIGASNIGTLQLLFFAFLAGTVASAAFVLYMKRVPQFKALLSDRRSLAILGTAGILNFAGAQLFLTLGVLGTNPVIVSIVGKVWPILLALMIPFTIKTKVHWQQIAALLMAFAGIYIVVTSGTVLTINAQELPYIGFILVSSVCLAVSNIMIKGQNHDLPSELLLFNIASLVVVTALVLITGTSLAISINTMSLLSILFIGLITYSGGSMLYFYALKALDPLMAANASYSTPFLTIIFSYLILGTVTQIYYLYALVPILLALYIQNRYASKAPKYIGAKKKHDVPFYDVTGAFVESTHPQIYAHIRGNGRVLAAKLKSHSFAGLAGKDQHNCLMFTNKEYPESIQDKEIRFIEDILAPQPDEVMLMAAGDVNNVENALNEHL